MVGLDNVGMEMNPLAATTQPPRPRSGGLATVTPQIVAKVASALASQSDLDAVMNTILATLVEMGARASHVLLLDSENGRLVLAAHRGVPSHIVEQISVLSLDAPMIAARAAKHREIEVLADAVDMDPSLTISRDLLRATGSASLLAAPLIAFGALVGVLTWTHDTPLTLTDDELATIRSMAEIFALGIVNAHNVSALRRSNQRFETIIDSAPIGMALISLDGRFLRVNGALCDIVGYPAEELLKLRFLDITHPEDLSTDLELADKLARGQIPRYSLGKRFIRKDGKIISANFNGSAVRNDAGKIDYFIAQIVDVTQAKLYEESLRQSESRFRLLAENAQDMVYRYRIGDHPGFEYVSPSATRITGYTPEEHYANPQLGFKIIHPNIRAALEQLASDSNESTQPYVLRFIRKDGQTLWVEQVNTPVRDDQGKLIAVEGIARDITERKNAEDALTESEERLRFIVAHSPDSIFIQDQNLRYVWVANTLAGYKPEEFLGKTEFDMLPWDQAARISSLKRQVMETGESLHGFLPTSYQGQEMQLEVNFSPWRDRIGNIIGVAGFTRDITQNKRTEEALRRSEESLRLAQSVARIGSWDWDLTTNALRWSAEVFRIFGIEPRPITYDEFLQFLPVDDRASLEARLREALSGGARYELVHRIVRPDGQTRVLQEVADIIGPPGHPQRMIGTTQDITERNALEMDRERLLHAIESEKQWIERIIERSPIGIILIDRQGNVQSNKRAEYLFGHPLRRDQGPTQYAGQIYSLDGKAVPHEELVTSRITRGESIENAEFIVRRPDGSSLNVMGSATPIIDSDGKMLGGVCVFEDITPIRDLERLREEWIGIIAHDLRQPLTAMAMQVDLLKIRSGDKGDTHTLDAFLQSIDRMKRMTQELLDASVIEAKRLEIKATRRDLIALTTEILNRAREIPASLNSTLDEVPVLAYVDPQRYEQILLNLLTNAVKYGKANTPIQIEIRKRGQQALISVTNAGEGIPAHEIPTIFERFRRTERGKARATGVGLGLYIVKGLIEAHGGKIWVDSTPGESTTFTFSLPIAAQH